VKQFKKKKERKEKKKRKERERDSPGRQPKWGETRHTNTSPASSLISNFH